MYLGTHKNASQFFFNVFTLHITKHNDIKRVMQMFTSDPKISLIAFLNGCKVELIVAHTCGTRL